MNSSVFHNLILKAQAYSWAYVRNLATAEQAVLAGQFNAAKVLRAAAHAQRVLAMNAARLTAQPNPVKVFNSILEEVETASVEPGTPPETIGQHTLQAKLDQFGVVESQLKDMLSRALASLQTNPDVPESDVNQIIWGCFSCGYLMEGDAPDACPVCGALDIEFEVFEPFYSSTAEHLGHRTPGEILTTLESIPSQVEELIGGVGDDVLSTRASEQEWSVKEIVGHIIEVEKLFLKRVQTILAEQGIPALPRTAAPWTLHEGMGYENRTAAELIHHLKETRSETLALLTSLKDADWTRLGSNQGHPVSLLELGTWLTNHDIGHVAQIQRYLP